MQLCFTEDTGAAASFCPPWLGCLLLCECSPITVTTVELGPLLLLPTLLLKLAR